jgi:hypothetical protein
MVTQQQAMRRCYRPLQHVRDVACATHEGAVGWDLKCRIATGQTVPLPIQNALYCGMMDVSGRCHRIDLFCRLDVETAP